MTSAAIPEPEITARHPDPPPPGRGSVSSADAGLAAALADILAEPVPPELAALGDELAVRIAGALAGATGARSGPG